MNDATRPQAVTASAVLGIALGVLLGVLATGVFVFTSYVGAAWGLPPGSILRSGAVFVFVIVIAITFVYAGARTLRRDPTARMMLVWLFGLATALGTLAWFALPAFLVAVASAGAIVGLLMPPSRAWFAADVPPSEAGGRSA